MTGLDDQLVFIDEAIFHVNGKVNKHNIFMWDTGSSHEILDHQGDPKDERVLCYVKESGLRLILLCRNDSQW